MEAFPQAPRPFIDLSTGINPHAYPLPALPGALFEQLPQRQDTESLEAVAAQAFGVAQPQGLMAVPGTQALIQRLPDLLRSRNIGILGPTYSGHSAAWNHAGASVSELGHLQDLHGFDAAIVVNPNNPDGRLVEIADLEILRQRNQYLVVDEAFIDLMPAAASFAARAALEGSNVMVLRSFGKTYGLAGVRLGFGIGAPAIINALRRSFGDWAISGPAQFIGKTALADMAWRQAMAERLERESQRLTHLLGRAGWADAGGTMLFRLARHEAAGRWFRHLARHGILTRPFAGAQALLRFGLPKGEDEWQRLGDALSTGP
ncbi:MAG: threonine-phosphate decarboxylase [Hyphomicrobiales bacterium]|nr:threonine-phosphate decarboxylase [Hyphomicrobiales bacterium]